MTDREQQSLSPQSTTPSRWTGEKTTWWIVFGVLVVSIFAMLGAWN